MNPEEQLESGSSQPARVLAALFVVTLVAAAICVNFCRGPAPPQLASAPTQANTPIAGVPTTNFVVNTQIVIERFLMPDVFGNPREVSPSEFFRSRAQSQDLIDFHSQPPIINLR